MTLRFFSPPIFNHPCMSFIILNNELFIKIRYYVALYNILFLYILHKKIDRAHRLTLYNFFIGVILFYL